MKLNGKSQTTETLAYGSNVYIPITEVPKLTGATLKKDQSTYNINPVKKEDGITRKNIDNIKLMVQSMDLYNKLYDFHDGFYLIRDFLDYSYYDIIDNGSVNELNDTIKKYNELVSILNQLQKEIDTIEKAAKAQGFNFENDAKSFNDIIQDYDSSLYYISKALDDLESYYNTSDNRYVSEYQKMQIRL